MQVSSSEVGGDQIWLLGDDENSQKSKYQWTRYPKAPQTNIGRKTTWAFQRPEDRKIDDCKGAKEELSRHRLGYVSHIWSEWSLPL